MKLLEKIEKHSFLVGGAVRDQLLNLPVTDKDYALISISEAELVSAEFEKVGKSHSVFLHPESKDEYSLLRGEISESIESDLKARDLTINAMALDSSGNLIDPCNGKSDLESKTLRHCGESFFDDPLRVYRLARFYALYEDFKIADETIQFIKENIAKSDFHLVSGERILKELSKSFAAKKPSRFFDALKLLNAMRPGFEYVINLDGVEERKDYHPEGDSYTHTMMVLDRAREISTDFDILYSALVHDLGKALTPKEILPHHYGHEHRGLKPIKKLNRFLVIPGRARKLSLFVCKNHLKIYNVLNMRAVKIVNLLRDMQFKQGDQFLEKFLLVCFADRLKSGEFVDFKEANFLLACSKAMRETNLKEEIELELNKENIEVHYIKLVEKQRESFL